MPDGTPVRFILYNEGGSNPAQTYETQTMDGIAHGQLRVSRDGELTIKAESEPADLLIITIEIAPEQGTATEIPATPEPTSTPNPTLTPTDSPTLTPTMISTPIVPVLPASVHFGDWLFALLLTSGVGGIKFDLAKRKHSLRWSIRAALLTIIGGFLAYSYLAVGLPGSQGLIKSRGSWVFWEQPSSERWSARQHYGWGNSTLPIRESNLNPLTARS